MSARFNRNRAEARLTLLPFHLALLDRQAERFELGAASYLTLLNAERAHQQARIGLVQAQAARFSDTAALFQALGGGWWNRAPEVGVKSTSKKE